MPTAHPALVDHDQDAWELICQEGLAGFTGIPDERSEERYETVGGQEIGKMVKGLWPEEYYETIWVCLFRTSCCDSLLSVCEPTRACRFLFST